MTADVLDRRALNRALLARQLLLHRAELPVPDALEHLVGLQAQAPNPPYVALWTRLRGFRVDALAALIRDRAAVRVALMRSTIHLVTARDCLALRPALQPALDRVVRSSYGRDLTGVDVDALAAAGRELLADTPHTTSELGTLLAARWPDRPVRALRAAVRAAVPLVQVPPRGLWGHPGPAVHATAQAWLGAEFGAGAPLDDVVLRYLGAFGPASVADAQAWSGLVGLGEVLDRLRPRLRTFRDDRGRALVDLPDAPRPDPDTPAPPRLLAEFDNVLLSHADRSRITPDEHRARVNRNGIVPGTVLVDGFVRGTWRIVRHRRGATLVVEPFTAIGAGERAGLAEEAARLLEFAEPDADSRDVHIAHPEL